MKIYSLSNYLLLVLAVLFLIQQKSYSQSEGTLTPDYSGLYKGIYFEEDDGATIKMDICPIILINDTCKYFYFGEILISDFSIEENVISFNKFGDYSNTIYIGEAIIKEEDENYGTVIYKTSDNQEKMLMV